MKKEELLEEMLNEVKDIKDFAKEEIPFVAKEYIFAQKVQNYFALIVGLAMLMAASTGALYRSGVLTEKVSDGWGLVVGIASILFFIVGGVATQCAISELIDLHLQPRRMAIKAITSLFKNP